MPAARDSKAPTPNEIKRRLEKLEDGKVNKDVYRAEKENFKEDLVEAKNIALAANAKAANPHLQCNKAEKVDAMEKEFAGFGKLKLAAVLSLIVVVATAVAGIVRTQSSVEAMDSTVKELKAEREKAQKKAAQEERQREDRLAEQRAIVTAAVKAAFKEAQEVRIDINERDRRTGRPRRPRTTSGRAAGRGDP